MLDKDITFTTISTAMAEVELVIAFTKLNRLKVKTFYAHKSNAGGE